MDTGRSKRRRSGSGTDRRVAYYAGVQPVVPIACQFKESIMKVRNWNRWVLALALSSMVTVPMLRADDDEGKAEQRRFSLTLVNASGKQWLGLHAVPIDDALKSQLGLTNRLIVQHVIPDSPAAKAGLQ